MKVTTRELHLGDVLSDGARVVGRERGGIVLARPVEDGWHREIRHIFDWPSGDPKEVSLQSRLRECPACGHGVSESVVHALCAPPAAGPTLEQAVDALLALGGRLLSPAAIGQLGPWHPALANVQFTVFDLETTGLHRKNDRIVELAAIRLSVGGEIARLETLVNPGMSIPAESTRIHGITDDDVAGAPSESEALCRFADLANGSVLVAHNIEFDAAFVLNGTERHGIEVATPKLLDTLELARGKPGKPGLIERKETENYKLETLTRTFGIKHDSAHRAMSDVEATVQVMDFLLKRSYRRKQVAERNRNSARAAA